MQFYSISIFTNMLTDSVTTSLKDQPNTQTTQQQSTIINDDQLNKDFRRGLGRIFIYILGCIGAAFIYNYIKYKDEYNIKLPSNLSNNELPLSAYIFSRIIPNRAISRILPPLFNKEIPIWLRKPIYSFYGLLYDIKWSDFKNDITQYKSLRNFFIRKLENDRIIANNDIISPVDGTVLTFGEIIKDESNDYILEQIKGVPYKLKQFIGEIPTIKPNNKLYYIIIYLGPGDYHRFHASNTMLIKSINHIVGDLYPVRTSWLKKIPGLFSLNERIILKGFWNNNNNDIFYYIPVGAFNVGSIKLYCDKDITTNIKIQDNDIWYKNTNKILGLNELDEDLRNALWNVNNKEYSPYFKNQKKQNPFNKQYYQNIDYLFEKGDEIGHFEFGSTVVMLFEANQFLFKCKENTKISFGDPIGDCVE